MRIPERLSYSSLTLFEKDPQTFFMTRLAGTRTRREPQGVAAAIGSAYDARVKSSLAAACWGSPPAELEFDRLYESQVEPQNRTDSMLRDSQYLLDVYKRSGRFADLLTLLEMSSTEPRFESETLVTVDGVPVTTKPDLTFSHRAWHVIHDWKVKSFYSASGASPTPGYVRWRDGETASEPHKRFRPLYWGDIVGSEGCLSTFSEQYADQTSLYAWAMGVTPGEEFIASVDELVCRPAKGESSPWVRVSELRAAVSTNHQRHLAHRLRRCWDALQRQHVFLDLSLEESQAKQARLERAAQTMGCDSDDDRYMAMLGRKAWF